MTIITEKQRHEIMQMPEFHKEFDKLTKGWKPARYPDVDRFYSIKQGLTDNTPFAAMGMDLDTYLRFVNANMTDLEWGILHKVLVYAMNLNPSNPLAVNYISLITDFHATLQEIENFVTQQQEKAIKSVFLSLKAKNNIIKPL